ncbi:patatin-like phospholipase family protein [Pseudochelatococcus lubricantis]|uniref:patatin-like phospholipase family protein n=1 Tax=Pseudochelatococcus lubricantis TaxID=1538102 RepID=UPI0035EFA2E7
MLDQIFRLAGIIDLGVTDADKTGTDNTGPERAGSRGETVDGEESGERPEQEMPNISPRDAGKRAAPAAPQLGLALGGGAARGWAHIGVIKVLAREGLRPAVIAGTSIGAVVGGCYAAGRLSELEAFARSLTKRRIVSLMDFHLNGSGLLGGDRLQKLLHEHLGPTQIEDLPIRFAAVATELGSGHEVWLTRGPLAEALRASYALPGVFDAIRVRGRWLMDGALVNPIPVTTARVLGAEAVIAVNLNGDPRARAAIMPAIDLDTEDDPPADASGSGDSLRRSFFAPLQNALPATLAAGPFSASVSGPRRERGPGLATVLMDAFNITQDRIARSRLAGDPPDITISPRLARVGLFDFDNAAEIIELGVRATERALPDIEEYLTGRLT